MRCWLHVLYVLTTLLNTILAMNCSIGYFMLGNVCNPCFRGTFLNKRFHSQCHSCPAGKVATCLGSSQCIACPSGLMANMQKTECIFTSMDLNIELQYENNNLCLELSYLWTHQQSFRVSFGSSEQQNSQQDTQYNDVHHGKSSCTVTTSKNKKTISWLSNVSLVDCTDKHLRVCMLDTDNQMRKAQVEIKVREFRLIDDKFFFGNSMWKAAAWTIDRDCDDLHYLDDRSNSPQDWKCRPCPSHASCKGATNFDDLLPFFGYRRLNRNDACENISECGNHRVEKFEPCLHPPACLGASNPEFHTVYPNSNTSHGELCNIHLGYRNSSRGCRACLPKYFSEGNVLCTACPTMAWNVITTIFALGVFILFLFVFLSKSLSDSERLSTKDDVTYSNLAQSMEKIMISHAQILGLMAGFPLRWPVFLRQFFWIFALFSNPAAYLFNPSCFGVDDTNRSLFMLKHTFVLSLPFLLVIPLTLFWFVVSKCSSIDINDTQKNLTPAASKESETKATTSESSTVFGGATHLKREELKALFEQAAASRNGETISRNQFVKLVLQHGDILGHDWRPRDVKYIFDQRKHQFAFGKNSHYHKNGLALEGFIAGVVNHLHARHELNMKLQRAHGYVDMVEHHDGSTKGSEKITHMDKWINTFISLLYMLYPTLCTATFSLVGCTRVGEFNEYIQGDMEFQCWKTTEHVVFVVLLFVPAFLVFVVGLPVASLIILRRNQHLLHRNRRVKFQLSILCVGYRPSLEYWESIVSLRKGLVVGISIFVLQAGPKLQTLAAQVLIGLLLVLQTSYQPYVKVATRHDPLNSGEFFGLMAAFVTLTCGMYLYHYGDSSSGTFKITVSVAVILINVLFFVLSIRWYTIVYLVDLEMTLDRDTKNKNISNSYLAYCLQKCLPDWREESHTDDIENAGLHRRRIAQLMSVDRLMRIHGFAKRWVERTRLSLEKKKVDAIERDSELMKEKFQKKLRGLSNSAHDRLELKLKIRRRSKVQKEALMVAAAAASASSFSSQNDGGGSTS